MDKITIPVILDDASLAPIYSTDGASGADVRARLSEPLLIRSGSFALIPTGLRVEIPLGFEIQIRPRSGLAAKFGITVLNTPGTIDADYRGEIQVILINLGPDSFTVEPCMRIAQMVLCPVVQAQFRLQSHLAETVRSGGGFGHTGTK